MSEAKNRGTSDDQVCARATDVERIIARLLLEASLCGQSKDAEIYVYGPPNMKRAADIVAREFGTSEDRFVRLRRLAEQMRASGDSSMVVDLGGECAVLHLEPSRGTNSDQDSDWSATKCNIIGCGWQTLPEAASLHPYGCPRHLRLDPPDAGRARVGGSARVDGSVESPPFVSPAGEALAARGFARANDPRSTSAPHRNHVRAVGRAECNACGVSWEDRAGSCPGARPSDAADVPFCVDDRVRLTMGLRAGAEGIVLEVDTSRMLCRVRLDSDGTRDHEARWPGWHTIEKIDAPREATNVIPMLVTIEDEDRAAAAALLQEVRYLPDSKAQALTIAHAFAMQRRREREKRPDYDQSTNEATDAARRAARDAGWNAAMRHAAETVRSMPPHTADERQLLVDAATHVLALCTDGEGS